MTTKKMDQVTLADVRINARTRKAVLDRLDYAVRNTVRDDISNYIARLYERVAAQGAPFEAPLTEGEVRAIGQFV